MCRGAGVPSCWIPTRRATVWLHGGWIGLVVGVIGGVSACGVTGRLHGGLGCGRDSARRPTKPAGQRPTQPPARNRLTRYAAIIGHNRSVIFTAQDALVSSVSAWFAIIEPMMVAKMKPRSKPLRNSPACCPRMKKSLTCCLTG